MMSYFTEGNVMLPQIFVSSTFYDLKYVREGLGEFIRNYGFEPILFEKGDVGYAPCEELDASCYQTMRYADMCILVVGGKYGSPATGYKKDDFKEYMSVTRREFETAVKDHIPVYAFVEAAVLHEYGLYKKNKDKIETQSIDIEFTAVDNINVFRFVENIYCCRTIPVNPFHELQDIKNFLKKQWADMFKTHLRERKSNLVTKELGPSISEMYTAIQKMEIVLQNVGEKIIGPGTEEFKKLTDEQRLENVAGKLASSFEFISGVKDVEKIKEYLRFFVRQLREAGEKNMLEAPFSDDADEIMQFYSLFDCGDMMITLVRVKEHLQYEQLELQGDETYIEQIVECLMKEAYLSKMKII